MTASELQKSPPDIIRMLGAEWKGLSEAQKQPYNDKYEKLKAEHDRVMEKWTEKMVREGKMSGGDYNSLTGQDNVESKW